MILLVAAGLSGGCHVLTPTAPSGPIEPFATVEPLDGGAVYLEVDPLAQRVQGAVMRVNDRAWAAEAVVRRGDRIEIGYGQAPHPGRLAYRLIGRSPAGGAMHFEVSRWFDDGFPARTHRVTVLPYRDRSQAVGAR